MKAILGIVLAVSLLLVVAPKAFADLTDDLRESTKKIRENTRTFDHVTEILSECNDTGNNREACASVLYKFDIDVSKALDESKSDIEDIVYPLTVPNNVINYNTLDSSAVSTSVNDTDSQITYAIDAKSFMDVIKSFAEECASKARAYDIDGVKTCMNVADTMNNHLRDFNENTKAEFKQVLG